jgi:ribosomal protein S4E
VSGPADHVRLGTGDRVLVRYGRFAGRVGEVEEVSSREGTGRAYEVIWVRFGDRSVECFNPENLLKEGGKK